MRPDLFHINLYDLTALGTLFTGTAFALLLGFAKRPGQKANLFLSLALGVIIIKTSGISAGVLPVLGPLLYFYGNISYFQTGISDGNNSCIFARCLQDTGCQAGLL